MLNVRRPVFALSHDALPTADMSLYIYVRVPQVAHSQWLDRPFPQLCGEFSGVESLSDIMDGDPPESMRLGNQGSPSIWRKRRPAGVGRKGGGGLCAMCMCEPEASD